METTWLGGGGGLFNSVPVLENSSLFSPGGGEEGRIDRQIIETVVDLIIISDGRDIVTYKKGRDNEQLQLGSYKYIISSGK